MSSRSYIWRYNSATGRWKDVAPKQVGADCPVKSFAVQKGTELWALFRQRVWPVNVHGRDPFLALYRFQRCSNWRKTPSVLRYRNRRWERPVELEHVLPKPHGTFMIEEIAASGNRIQAWDLEGTWVGPGKWRRSPSPGVPTPQSARWSLLDLHENAHRTGRRNHSTMLVHRSRKWAAGPLGGPVTETAVAFWVAMDCQLVRLDKAELNKGLRDLLAAGGRR